MRGAGLGRRMRLVHKLRRRHRVAQNGECGAIITTMDQIVSELAIDWTSPNGQKLQGILAFH